MFTDLYLQTTNPKLGLSQWIRPPILPRLLGSIVFHTVAYASFVNLVSFIFTGKLLSRVINYRLIVSIALIMMVGFIARFFHVKEIHKAYRHDLDKTRAHLDKLYISWLFLS